MKKMCNLIRSTKRDRPTNDAIAMFKLHNYFKDKFLVLSENDVLLTAKQEVHDKYEELRNGVCNDKVMSETMITRCIQKLHSGSSPGMDGISAEHLK